MQANLMNARQHIVTTNALYVSRFNAKAAEKNGAAAGRTLAFWQAEVARLEREIGVRGWFKV